jgi:hypothetical protein
MIHGQPTLQHHFFEIPITERIAQIPPDAQENDIGLKVTPFERILALIAHEGNLFGLFPPTLTDRLFICPRVAQRGDSLA